jgi:hypothetical protein
MSRQASVACIQVRETQLDYEMRLPFIILRSYRSFHSNFVPPTDIEVFTLIFEVLILILLTLFTKVQPMRTPLLLCPLVPVCQFLGMPHL